MIGESHRQAEVLAAEAAAALASGRKLEAFELYSKAAALERAAFGETPEEKQRTRSILAVSFISLLYKARKYTEAELGIFALLASRQLLPWAELQLRELLEAVTDEKLIQERLNRQYTGESITVALRGGDIGAGTGPLDLILEKAGGFKNLFYRFAEYVGNYPLRFSGAPPKALIDFLQVRATQASAGSYRLEIRLTEPTQLSFLERSPISPPVVSDTLFEFLRAVNAGKVETVEALVPHPGYRKALLELTRSIAPTGKRLTEIGVYRGKGEEIETVYLTTALPERVRQFLPQKPRATGAEPEELQGVLRAVHLDENWLEVTLPRSVQEKCDTMPDMLDDMVGPMVNREVIVRGTRRTKAGGGPRRLMVEEIELAEPD
jgi:hypothetical protein